MIYQTSNINFVTGNMECLWPFNMCCVSVGMYRVASTLIGFIFMESFEKKK